MATASSFFASAACLSNSRWRIFSARSSSWRRINSAWRSASLPRRANSSSLKLDAVTTEASSASTGATIAAGACTSSSLLMKVRCFFVVTWIVRALPVLSACLISEVVFFVSVSFLSLAALPALACKKTKSFCLSASVTLSLASLLATPALFSCSSSFSGVCLSSTANSETVVFIYI